MSGPFQVGDIIAIASLAKKLFEFGWERRYSSCGSPSQFPLIPSRPGKHCQVRKVYNYRAEANLHFFWIVITNRNRLIRLRVPSVHSNVTLRLAARKYNEFGQDVDALRYNLDLLATVIQSADYKLYDLTRSRTAALTWDPRSLGQIIGDCWKTIYECDELLSDNSSYAVDAGPVRNVRWNLMVQDDVDALQFRIQQHTAKIHLALAPFEM